MKTLLSKLRNLTLYVFSMETDKNGKEEIEGNLVRCTGKVLYSKNTYRTREKNDWNRRIGSITLHLGDIPEMGTYKTPENLRYT